MAEKRFSKRIAFRNIVRYGTSTPPEHMSFITDLSDTGVCIKTTKVFKPGTTLNLTFEMENGDYHAIGIVRWAKVVPPTLLRVVKAGMGIQFIDVDEKLLKTYHVKRNG